MKHYLKIALALMMMANTQVQAQQTEQTDSVIEKEGGELNELVISTRGRRAIRNQPTRVERLGGEEIDEKGMMKPGDIRTMLSETTGIMTQQTSAISGNALIRIQGLDGRYTLVLKDGFPVFAGAASGLGLLQTPPLDLRSVEIIKGSTSTLYGGGAIAGLVNLISKVPSDTRELNFQVNGTTTGGLDVNAFYAQRYGKLGATIFTSYNSSRAYDPSDTGFSALPQYRRFSFNPRLFLFLSPRTSGNISLNSMWENRLGGDMDYIRERHVEGHTYFERNKSERHSLQLTMNHWLEDDSRLALKASVSYYWRGLTQPDYEFDGKQWSSFSELSYGRRIGKVDWVAGANLWTDHFDERPGTTPYERDYTQTTWGAFVQADMDISKWLAIETGLRTDYLMHYGAALLPRLSLLFRPSTAFTSRLGGGMGYKAPTIFTEETERIAYQNVRPINTHDNRMERSWGLNWDFNYVTSLLDGEVALTVNQLFFYTKLDNTLLMKADGQGHYKMVNIDGHTDTQGWETNVKVGWRDFHYYLGYTYTDTRVAENGQHNGNPLSPRHRLNNVLMYEVEDKWKAGFEAYYYSAQQLSDGLRGQDYWLCGFMVERIWPRFSIYVNFENFTDTRQTRFDTIYTGSRTHPEWRDIYAPLDGFVANAGIKVRL